MSWLNFSLGASESLWSVNVAFLVSLAVVSDSVIHIGKVILNWCSYNYGKVILNWCSYKVHSYIQVWDLRTGR